MRPIYETDDDRAREATVAEAVAKHWSVDLQREEELAVNDYRLIKGGKWFAVLEVKCRTGYSWTKLRFMGSYMLSLEKWHELWKICAAHKVALCIAVADKHGEVWAGTWRGKPPVYDARRGGRRDRGDAKDIEWVVLIPIGDFDILIRDRDLTKRDRK